jgi:putative cell wall-binding protein
VAAVAISLAASLGAAAASLRVSATPSAQLVRLSGADRIATAVATSVNSFSAGQAGAAVLARSDDFPDALTGTALAIAKDGPLLLTAPQSLDPRVAAELSRVLPPGKTVYLLGGPAALSPAVANAVAALGYQVVRFGGVDRFQTATIIASEGLGNPAAAFVTTGMNFPDALVSGVAAAKVHGAVLLTDDTAMPAATASYLQAHPATVIHAVGPGAAAVVGASASDQFVGTDRFDTARLIAEHFFPAPTEVGIASGMSFADAMSGGAHIAHLGGPLLLSDTNALSLPTQDYLTASEGSIASAFVYGGPLAISAFAEAGVQAAVTGAPPPTTTSTSSTSSTSTTAAAGGGHFSTLPPGSTLPGDATCASEVRGAAENRPGNASYNATPGAQKNLAGPYPLFGRVDGNFTGTTDQIIQWAACKWGIDEDTARAQAAVESWWHQTNFGDFATDPSTCVPNHPIGADGVQGQCPNTIGLLSVRYSESQDAFPEAETSTAYNIDYAYAAWRSCFEGLETWLNTVDRVGTYGPGDLWGCIGVWYAGRWHTAAAGGYISKVQTYLNERIWTQSQFAGG